MGRAVVGVWDGVVEFGAGGWSSAAGEAAAAVAGADVGGLGGGGEAAAFAGVGAGTHGSVPDDLTAVVGERDPPRRVDEIGDQGAGGFGDDGTPGAEFAGVVGQAEQGGDGGGEFQAAGEFGLPAGGAGAAGSDPSPAPLRRARPLAWSAGAGWAGSAAAPARPVVSPRRPVDRVVRLVRWSVPSGGSCSSGGRSPGSGQVRLVKSGSASGGPARSRSRSRSLSGWCLRRR